MFLGDNGVESMSATISFLEMLYGVAAGDVYINEKRKTRTMNIRGRARIVNSPHAHFVCCLGLGLETSLQVCARPPGLYRKSYSGPKIFDRSVCLYVPVSKVHHRNTIAPFFMMMCVRRTETSKDSEKLVTTYAPPLFGADDQY